MSNIVVTGTSSGFGRLIVETLAKDGHTVFAGMREASGRNAKAAQELKALSASGLRVHVVDIDVTSDQSVQQAIGTIARDTAGAIDVLINNAGRFSLGVQEAYTLDEIKSLFDLNVFGPLRLNRAVLPYMRKRRSGLIVNTSSIAGRLPLPFVGVYSATKSALEALAETQRDELKGLGIDVVLIEPGAFPTQVNSNCLYASDAERAGGYGELGQMPQKIDEGLAQLFASPMSPKPQEVADAVKKLVDTPAGQRPTRVVVDNLTGDPVRALNAAHETHRQVLLTAFGLA